MRELALSKRHPCGVCCNEHAACNAFYDLRTPRWKAHHRREIPFESIPQVNAHVLAFRTRLEERRWLSIRLLGYSPICWNDTVEMHNLANAYALHRSSLASSTRSSEALRPCAAGDDSASSGASRNDLEVQVRALAERFLNNEVSHDSDCSDNGEVWENGDDEGTEGMESEEADGVEKELDESDESSAEPKADCNGNSLAYGGDAASSCDVHRATSEIDRARGSAVEHAMPKTASCDDAISNTEEQFDSSTNQQFMVGDHVVTLGTKSIGIIVNSTAPPGKVCVRFDDGLQRNVFASRLRFLGV